LKEQQLPRIHGRDHTWRGADPISADWTYVGDTDAPAFQNGWGNVGGTKAPMRYRYLPAKDTDSQLPCVEIQGSVTGGALGTTIFTIPLTLDYDVHLPASDDMGTFTPFTVKQNGDVVWGIA
jgi:hypothetical protein